MATVLYSHYNKNRQQKEVSLPRLHSLCVEKPLTLSSVSVSVSPSVCLPLSTVHEDTHSLPQVIPLPLTFTKSDEQSEQEGSRTTYWHSTKQNARGHTQPISFFSLAMIDNSSV